MTCNVGVVTLLDILAIWCVASVVACALWAAAFASFDATDDDGSN